MEYISRLVSALQSIDQSDIQKLSDAINRSRILNGTIYMCGNGGSFANAQHWVCDLLKVANLRCFLLGSNLSLVTAMSNDISYECALVEEFNGVHIICSNDIVIVLSCSGQSQNIIELLARASKLHNVQSVLVTGSMHDVENLADIVIKVDSKEYGIIEDCHAAIGHMLVKELSGT